MTKRLSFAVALLTLLGACSQPERKVVIVVGGTETVSADGTYISFEARYAGKLYSQECKVPLHAGDTIHWEGTNQDLTMFVNDDPQCTMTFDEQHEVKESK